MRSFFGAYIVGVAFLLAGVFLIFPAPAQAEVMTQTVEQIMAQTSAVVCQRAGCNNELCVSAADAANAQSQCMAKPEFACYSNSGCAPQRGQACGWTQSTSLITCIVQARAVTSTIELTAQAPNPNLVYFSPIIAGDAPVSLELKSPFPQMKSGTELGYGTGFQLTVAAGKNYQFVADPTQSTQADSIKTVIYGPDSQQIKTGGNHIDLDALTPGTYWIVVYSINQQKPQISVQVVDKTCVPPPACLFRIPRCYPPLRNDYCDFAAEDLNHDGRIDINDYSILAYEFLQPSRYKLADINRDGSVDLKDYSLLVLAFTL